MSTEVVMPQMGESITEGTLTRWLKKIGEAVERDEMIFEISTDKVDAEIPSPAAGTLLEIKVSEGETVEVGTVVAVVGESNGAASASNGSATAATAASTTPASGGNDEATYQADGGELTAGAPVTSATPKDAAAQEAASIAAETGANTAAETVTAKDEAAAASSTATQSGYAQSATASSSNTQAAQTAQEPTAQKPPADASSSAASDETEDMRRARSSPLVRNIAREHNIDLAQLEGTGAAGRVTKNDIMSFIEQGGAKAAAQAQTAQTQTAQSQTQPSSQTPSATAITAAPTQPPVPSTALTASPAPQSFAAPHVQAGEGDRVEAMSVMRRKIAEHMIMSQTVSAHVATVYEIDMTRIARLRDANKKSFQERTGTKLTFMPFIFQAVTAAIREFPIFNAQVSGDQIIYKRDINLGMAVALNWGLIVPVIKRADDLSLAGLAKTANDLADRARNKQLKPDEVAGGTFTITNPGVFGGLFGTPIINQPQVAILAVGAIEKRPRVMTTEDGDEHLAIRTMAYFALSYDHRVVDGADAERFLSRVKQILEAGNFTV